MRRVVALLRWLPPDAAVWHGQPHSWSLEIELAAVQVELTHTVARLLMQLGGAKRHNLPAPLHVPRPDDDKKAPFDVSTFETYLARMQTRG